MSEDRKQTNRLIMFLKEAFQKIVFKAEVKFPDVWKVKVENPTEIDIPENITVKNLKEVNDVISTLSSTLVKAIEKDFEKTRKELKPKEQEKLGDKLEGIKKAIKEPKEFPDLITPLQELQELVKQIKLDVDLSPVLGKLDELKDDPFEKYSKFGEIKTRLNEKQFEKLVKAFNVSIASSGGNSVIKDADGNPYSLTNPLPVLADQKESVDLEGGGKVSVGTTAVEVTFTGTTQSIIITADKNNTGLLFIGESNVASDGSNAMTFLERGDSLELDYNDSSNAVYVVSDTASQNFYKGAVL